jgi:DNA-binding transcriptional LysR family regulator
VRVSVEIGPRARVLQRIAEHAVDIVIGGRPPPGSGLRTWGWRPNALVVVGAPGPAPDLSTATWLLREPGSGTREATLTLLRSRDLDPPTLTLGSHGAVVAAAGLGLGVTLVSEDAVEHLLAADRLVRVTTPGTPLTRPWHVVARATPTPAARLFLAHVRQPELAGPACFRTGRPAASPTGRAPGGVPRSTRQTARAGEGRRLGTA